MFLTKVYEGISAQKNKNPVWDSLGITVKSCGREDGRRERDDCFSIEYFLHNTDPTQMSVNDRDAVSEIT